MRISDWSSDVCSSDLLERRGLLVPVPVGLEGDLRHVALIGPEGSDLLAARRRCPVRQDHLRVFGVDAVEQVPDEVMIVEARSRAEADQRAGGDQPLLFGPLPRFDEIPTGDAGQGRALPVAFAPGARGQGLAAWGRE